MKKILAISGGVDSMVLLDIFRKDPDILVAHFNHGTRDSAEEDEKFVKEKCKELGVAFCSDKLVLGEKVSEETAREKRYIFLERIRQDIEKKSGTKTMIFTAHHLDDLVESVLINLIRGTGWRGLTPFSAKKVIRPFLANDPLLPESKGDILTYAYRHKISFREDPSNSSDKYLRNRIRQKLQSIRPEKKYELNQKIKMLYFLQQSLRSEITEICNELVEKKILVAGDMEIRKYRREFFVELDKNIAIEILHAILEKEHLSLTNPQMENFLEAILKYEANKYFNLPKDRLIKMSKQMFQF